MEEALLTQVLTLLQRQGWVSHRTLRRRFHLDDTALAALIQTLLGTYPVQDADGTRLEWSGPVGLDLPTSAVPEDISFAEASLTLPPPALESLSERQAPPGRTRLVGREYEMAVLQACWEQAQAGQGQVVFLRGEVGIGKSRLLQAVQDDVSLSPQQYWECRCDLAAQQSALYPLIELLTRRYQRPTTATPADHLARLEAFLDSYDIPHDEVVPFLADLLSVPIDSRYPARSLTPAQRKQLLFAAIGAVLQAVAATHPVLCVVEDLHWSDPSTLELLRLLVEQVGRWRCLLLLSHRSEWQVPWPLPAHGTVLTLQRLLPAQVMALATQETAGKALPAFVLEEIVRRTEGVPLFVEEMTRLLCTTNVLQEVATVGGPGTRLPLALPATVQESVQVRLQALGPVAATVAQVAAVWGRAVTETQLIATVSYTSRQREQALAQLVTAGLLYEISLPPRLTYVFQHALVQEAVYGTMPETVRQQTHAQVAQVIVERFSHMLTAQPEIVAQHYTAAGQPSAAIRYWQQAGQRALERSANLEAVQHLSKGLELLASLPETPTRVQQELDLQLTLGPALIATKGPAAPEVEQTYARARVLCQQVGDTPQLFPTLWGLCRFYFNLGALPMARALGEELHRLAQHTGTPSDRLEAHDALGTALFYLGEYASARAHLEQGMALRDAAGPDSPTFRHDAVLAVECLTFMANALWCLGYPAQAVQRSQEALRLAHALEHPYSLVRAQFWAAFLHYRRREFTAVQAHADALLSLATTQGFTFWAAWGTYWQGLGLLMQGQVEAGLAQMQQGLAAVVATGQVLAKSFCLVLFADVMGSTGQVQEGLRVLADALLPFESSGRGDLLAEAHRLRGELLLRQRVPDMPQAESCFTQALHLARQQQARSWELRAALSLSRLWQWQGKRAAARNLLGQVYGWFTEGFDTADLQEARRLLQELSSL